MRRARARLAISAALGALAVACGSDPGQAAQQDLGGLTRVSGASPFTAGCQGAPQSAAPFTGAEVEPFVAIDPLNPAHLVGVWQQDRFPDSGSSGDRTAVSRDGGRTWTTTAAHFTRCSGGDASNGGDYERASDPWVTFSPDGTVHQIALTLDATRSRRKAVLASRSSDGGATWSEPFTIASEASADVGLDKETITADPADALFVYAVWDRLTGLTQAAAQQAGPAWFSRTTDGGASWEAARPIYDPGLDAQTIGSQILVLPDGTLVDVLVVITGMSQAAPLQQVAAIFSHDHGLTWSPQPIIIGQALAVGVTDPNTRQPVRSGSVLPAAAVDRKSGALYVVWEDARFGGGVRDGIVLSRSVNGGQTWSAPALVNQAAGFPAFTPAIAVAASGEVGVTYYDLSEEAPGDASRLSTSYWLVTSTDGGASWRTLEVARRFDLRNAPTSDGLFLGDYQGLVHDGQSFVPFFTMSNDGDQGNRTDVFTTTSAILAARASAVAAR
jgi:hypothetical protein